MNLAGHASYNFGHIAGFLRSVMKEIRDAVLPETSALYRRATKCRVDDAQLPWVSAYGEWSSGKKFCFASLIGCSVFHRRTAFPVCCVCSDPQPRRIF